MSYEIVSTVADLADGETAVKLTTDPGKGYLIAVRCDSIRVDPVTKRLETRAYARVVDTEGVTQKDANGHEIAAQHPVSGEPGQDRTELMRFALFSVLGEGDNADTINDDIRDAIASAAQAGTAGDISVALQ